MSSVPFSFALASGLFAEPVRVQILTAHALKTLTNLSNAPATPPATKELLAKALPHLCDMPLSKFYTSINQGDLKSPKFASHNNYVNGKWVEEVDHSSYARTTTSCTSLVLPGVGKTKFSPVDYDDVSSDADQWGWEHATALLPLLPALNKLCRSLKITLHTNHLTKAAQCHADFVAQKLSIRTPNAQADLGQAAAFVLYNPKSERYLSAKWDQVTLGSANMYETEAAAQRSLKAKGVWRDYVVVGVAVRLTHVVSAPPKVGSLGALDEAVALAERDAITDALSKAKTEELSAQLDARASSKPKRM